MSARRLVPPIAVLLLAPPAAAQQSQQMGTVELGVFGQYAYMDTPWAMKNGFGIGGRLGVFLRERYLIEGDFATSQLDGKPPRTPGTYQYQSYALRFVYTLPVGPNDFLIGVGVGGEKGDATTDFSVSPGIGYHWNVTKTFALRFDARVELVENPADKLFGFPPVTGKNVNAARSTNLEFRIGPSFRFGGREEAPPPPRAAPPITRPPVNQDSIDAERRREAQAAADAERARRDRARQDSINAANRARQDSIDAANRDRAAASARVRAILEQKIYFDLDKADLRDDAKSVLDTKVPILQANPNARIRVEGNADERGSDEYNLALGMRRAEQIKRYLVSRGIADSRIDVVSNGEEKPLCSSHEESCWSQNRRADFVIVAGGDSLVSPR